MSSDLESRLQRWLAAGIIDSAQAVAIRQAEAAQPPSSNDSSRPGLTEIMVVTGVALALAGVYLEIYLHTDSIAPAGRAAFNFIVAAIATMTAGLLERMDTVALRRSAASLVSLAAVAIAATVYEICLALQIFVTISWFSDGRPGNSAYGYTTTDSRGAALLSVAVLAVLGIGALLRYRGGLAALVVIGAVIGTGGTLAATLNAGTATVDVIFVVAGAVLFGVGGLPRLTAVSQSALRFSGVLLPVFVLLVSAPGDGNTWVAGAVAAGVIAIAGLGAGERLGSSGSLVGGGMGLFGVAVAVGAHTFADAIGFPIFLALCGFGLVATTLGLRRILVGRNASA